MYITPLVWFFLLCVAPMERLRLFNFILVPPLCAFLSRKADAPNTGLIPESDAVGVTVALITCTYHGQEFIRIGYYVNNEYTDPELRENPPLKPDYTQVTRTHRWWSFVSVMDGNGGTDMHRTLLSLLNFDVTALTNFHSVVKYSVCCSLVLRNGSRRQQ